MYRVTIFQNQLYLPGMRILLNHMQKVSFRYSDSEVLGCAVYAHEGT